jgi:F-type H+-transporting ATPase subunit epsilon
MAHHAPVMTALRPGLVKARQANGQEERYVVFGGFVDVTPEGCTLLAEEAVRVADLDPRELDQRIADAREDVADARDASAKARAEERLAHLMTIKSCL